MDIHAAKGRGMELTPKQEEELLVEALGLRLRHNLSSSPREGRDTCSKRHAVYFLCLPSPPNSHGVSFSRGTSPSAQNLQHSKQQKSPRGGHPLASFISSETLGGTQHFLGSFSVVGVGDQSATNSLTHFPSQARAQTLTFVT